MNNKEKAVWRKQWCVGIRI